MQEIWRDRIVEESNLTFNIKMLRKALGDRANEPRFIETVPRRGYRFVANVKESCLNGIPTNGRSRKLAPTTEEISKRSFRSTGFLVLLSVLALIGAVILIVLWPSGASLTADTPILSAPFASEKISNNGKVPHAVISPDGKNAVYLVLSVGKGSVWLRQLESGNNVEILPPTEDIYFGFAFSPDGNFLYFTRRQRNQEGQANVYKVSIFGGVPSKIVDEVQGWISISPDGGKISYVRCYYRKDENCSLWIADSKDGSNERKLISRPPPIRIGDNRISPSGKTIAFAVGQSENQANQFQLAEVDVDTGVERRFTDERFFNIKSLAWLPSGNGLLVTASRIPNNNFRIWQISRTSGEVSPQTKDSETYSSLSLDNEGKTLVSTRDVSDFYLSLYPMKVPSAGRVLADATTAAFAPNGQVIFSSMMTGNNEIWSISRDGSGQRQLSNQSADETAPVVSSDNNSIFFASNRTGVVHVWRMNPDGSNQVQITQNEGGFPLFVTTDGKWIYYHSGSQRTLWRVSTDGWGEQEVFNKPKYRFAISSDGSYLAYSEKWGDERVLTLVSLSDGHKSRTFPLPIEKARLGEIAWLPDGGGLVFVLADYEFRNSTLWLQSRDGRPPRKLAELGDEDITSLAVAPDGNAFAVVKGSWKHDAVLISGLK